MRLDAITAEEDKKAHPALSATKHVAKLLTIILLLAATLVVLYVAS